MNSEYQTPHPDPHACTTEAILSQEKYVPLSETRHSKQCFIE